MVLPRYYNEETGPILHRLADQYEELAPRVSSMLPPLNVRQSEDFETVKEKGGKV